jgi:hypothetical protein
MEVATELIGDALDRGCAIVMTAHDPLQFRHFAFVNYSLENGRLALAHYDPGLVGCRARSAATG